LAFKECHDDTIDHDNIKYMVKSTVDHMLSHEMSWSRGLPFYQGKNDEKSCS